MFYVLNGTFISYKYIKFKFHKFIKLIKNKTMASKSINLVCIPSYIDPLTYRITFTLVNYIDSAIKPWFTLKDAFPFIPGVKYPFKLYEGGPDHLGHVGEFWLTLKKNIKRRDSIAQYIKELTGTAVIVSVTPKKYSFKSESGEYKIGYSLIFKGIVPF
jgi:hypothetical protein